MQIKLMRDNLDKVFGLILYCFDLKLNTFYVIILIFSYALIMMYNFNLLQSLL